jgi:hypothetical protein
VEKRRVYVRHTTRVHHRVCDVDAGIRAGQEVASDEREVAAEVAAERQGRLVVGNARGSRNAAVLRAGEALSLGRRRTRGILRHGVARYPSGRLVGLGLMSVVGLVVANSAADLAIVVQMALVLGFRMAMVVLDIAADAAELPTTLRRVFVSQHPGRLHTQG